MYAYVSCDCWRYILQLRLVCCKSLWCAVQVQATFCPLAPHLVQQHRQQQQHTYPGRSSSCLSWTSCCCQHSRGQGARREPGLLLVACPTQQHDDKHTHTHGSESCRPAGLASADGLLSSAACGFVGGRSVQQAWWQFVCTSSWSEEISACFFVAALQT